MGCNKAREFLAREITGFEERDLFKEPLTEAEVRALSKRLGGVRELVAPKWRKELEGKSDAEVVKDLAHNPIHVRRPLIDTGGALYGGFTAEVREKLEGELKKRR